ncbi:MAG: hypothetical protein J7619_07605 [Dyadobacter sp.]|uniref:hypothetical protein n=1 Tax=Dyadobacter sp. TaxID=1914288 RepID=UPI001B003B91|nr:hypothetical protein [Dyadobacter sp.]MBO9612543.1 hypothetical protein [Dyadobacter sp.]
MQDRRRGVGQFDRRIKLVKPVNVPGRFNESNTGEAIVYEMFPAYREEPGPVDESQTKNNATRSVTQINWQIPFIRELLVGENKIVTDWKIIDFFTGQVYKVVSTATEIGRGYRIQINTELVG